MGHHLPHAPTRVPLAPIPAPFKHQIPPKPQHKTNQNKPTLFSPFQLRGGIFSLSAEPFPEGSQVTGESEPCPEWILREKRGVSPQTRKFREGRDRERSTTPNKPKLRMAGADPGIRPRGAWGTRPLPAQETPAPREKGPQPLPARGHWPGPPRRPGRGQALTWLSAAGMPDSSSQRARKFCSSKSASTCRLKVISERSRRRQNTVSSMATPAQTRTRRRRQAPPSQSARPACQAPTSIGAVRPIRERLTGGPAPPSAPARGRCRRGPGVTAEARVPSAPLGSPYPAVSPARLWGPCAAKGSLCP